LIVDNVASMVNYNIVDNVAGMVIYNIVDNVAGMVIYNIVDNVAGMVIYNIVFLKVVLRSCSNIVRLNVQMRIVLLETGI